MNNRSVKENYLSFKYYMAAGILFSATFYTTTVKAMEGTDLETTIIKSHNEAQNNSYNHVLSWKTGLTPDEIKDGHTITYASYDSVYWRSSWRNCQKCKNAITEGKEKILNDSRARIWPEQFLKASIQES